MADTGGKCNRELGCNTADGLTCIDTWNITDPAKNVSMGATCNAAVLCNKVDADNAKLYYNCKGMLYEDCASPGPKNSKDNYRNNTLCDTVGGFKCAGWFENETD